MMNHIEIVTYLEVAGFNGLFVGGCERDRILGVEVNDYDIATNASPEEIIRIFEPITKHIDAVGKQFGVIIVDNHEIATFRSETYEVVGKPTVKQVTTYYEDASRRDFTINTIASNVHGEVFDYFNGIDDINNKLVRAVGNPLDRFKEDPSRILRALYFAARFDFSIEEKTWETICNNIELVKQVPTELIAKIVEKVMKKNKLHVFLELLKEANLTQFVFPEINHTIGLEQNPKYHNSNVYDHITRVVKAAETRFPNNMVLSLASVFHDCAKGLPNIRGINKEGQPNDINHETEGEPIATNAVLRLQFGSKIANTVGFLVRFHGIRLPNTPKKTSIIKIIRQMTPYFENKEALIKGVRLLLDFTLCDADGFQPEFGDSIKEQVEAWQPKFEEVLNTTIFYRHELPINGQYLIKEGFQGKEIGIVLEELVKLNVNDIATIDTHIKKRRLG